MSWEIRRLMPDDAETYLKFFDEVAFTDHPDWSWCYCLEANTTEEDEKNLSEGGKEGRRAKAKEFIENGILRGYLAYENGEVVGWVNAGDKMGYKRVTADRSLRFEGDAPGRTVSILCFTIAPAMRRKGIATALIERVIADARENGFSLVEAYPHKDAHDCFMNYHGPAMLYEKYGFAVIQGHEYRTVVQKVL